MKNKALFGIALALAFAVSITLSPMFALAQAGFQTIDEAELEVDDGLLEVEVEANGDVPIQAGTLLGYGALTTGDSIVVATSHGGALDSILQSDANDPVWHNHYVQLTADAGCAGAGLGTLSVVEISFASPGEVEVDDEEVEIEDVPLGSITTLGAISNAPTTFNTGTPTGTVVAFGLGIGPSGQVCVNVTDAVQADD